MSKKLLHHFITPQASVDERVALGKALRFEHPRIKLGNYKASSKRVDPISILEKQAKTRLPELVPLRYTRMLTSPFAFLRGSAAVMASDLGAGGRPVGINVQACGDMHVANFGVFASAERNLVFGINDFDETTPGPFEWDLKRLVASIVSSGRFLGADEALCAETVAAAVRMYRKRMHDYAHFGNLQLTYARIGEEEIIQSMQGSAQAGALKVIKKAKQRTHMQVLNKLTDIIDEQHRFRDEAPFIVHETETRSGKPISEAISIFLNSYISSLADDRRILLKRYRIVDVARKVVGVGSVGTRCWVIFLTGNGDDDPLFLQLKEAQPSVLKPYVRKSAYENQGQRVVSGQRLIQGAPDIFLGWGEIEGFDFYVRQLRDMKGGVEFEPGKVKIENMPQYGSLTGWALALAHARSGDAAVLAGYVGNSDELDEAMIRFGKAYADQTEKDYLALAKAAKKGRVKVVS